MHVLASSHYVLTKRRNKSEALSSSSFEMRRADEAEVGDLVLINDMETGVINEQQ